eukprot:10416836-Lingulodinium_polyedra.AAC.1
MDLRGHRQHAAVKGRTWGSDSNGPIETRGTEAERRALGFGPNIRQVRTTCEDNEDYDDRTT